MRALVGSILLTLTLTLAAAPMAVAQEEQESSSVDPEEERATEFRAVEGPVTEDVPGGALMITAYAAIWILIFGYVFRLGRMSARTAADVRRLERSLADSAGNAKSDDEG